MKLHYYRAGRGNFGDDLNAWLWKAFLPGFWSDDDEVTFCGIGTLLGRTLPRSHHLIVFGSGAGYSALSHASAAQHWHTVCVRGPLTSEALGLAPSSAVSDGALLLSLLPEFSPLPPHERQGVVFMPHHYQVDSGNWPEACARAGIEFISPREDSRKILQRLRRASLVLADAMHAAISADAMRVPWIPLTTSSSTHTFKWLDWTQSMEVPYRPRAVPASSPFEALQGSLLSLIGEGFRLDEPSIPAAMEHYRRHLRRQGSYWTSLLSYGTKRVISGAHRMAESPLVRRVYQSILTDRTAGTAAALQAASRGPSFLSRDAIFLLRRDELARRLDQVKEIARSLGVRAGSESDQTSRTKAVEVDQASMAKLTPHL